MSVGLFCILLYMYGFFPIKTSSNIYSSREDFPTNLQDLKFHKEKLYNGSVGKTVMMVIDGMRVDFLTADNMPYTMGVLAEGRGEGCQLTARVSAPTVTLPRIKAIVTGSVSSYIDVVLNFGTVQLTSDNIVQQASRTKTVVFYGDDIWIKLLPGHFIRSEGTSSFFVNDYTEVDTNVTRHLDGELQRTDWDVMILHYLGLDHIGHIAGPKSPLIKPKLKEMDDVIARLHVHLKKQAGGMLVVFGDHGMKDSGSHGGVSLPEILVPVVLMGLSCPTYFKEEILQVDLAATLSVLWGAPIPADNIGVVAAGLLGHLTPAQRMYSFLYNTQQLAGNFLRNGGSLQHESYMMYEEAKLRHYDWLTSTNTVSYHQVEAMYKASLIGMSRFLSEVLANYDMLALCSATVLLLQVVCLLGLKLVGAYHVCPSIHSVLLLSAVIGMALVPVCRVSSLILSIWPLAVSLTWLLLISFNTLLLYQSTPDVFKVVTLGVSFSWRGLIPIGTVMFCASLFSSSLIEEEHQLWYFLWATVVMLQLVDAPKRWLSVLAAHRFLRTLNQTGDKWAHLPDISDWLTLSQNRTVLSILFVLSLALMCWCSTKLVPHRLSMFLCTCTAFCIYLHKAAVQQSVAFMSPFSSSGVTEARLCWLLIGVMLLLGRSFTWLIICWMLTSSLLLRTYNALLVCSLFLTSKTVSLQHSDCTILTTVLHHWLGAVFFFYQGNSNSLASIDLAAGYVGLEEYNIVVVAALLFMHTYSMPVLSYLLNIHSIINKSRYWKSELVKSVDVVVFLQLLHVFVCLIIITLHRYHLFVWTVFSPKLLYVAAQTFIYFLLISITNICICFVGRTNL